jgi:hypothetical protein
VGQLGRCGIKISKRNPVGLGLQRIYGLKARKENWAVGNLALNFDSRIFRVQLKRFKHFKTKFELNSK